VHVLRAPGVRVIAAPDALDGAAWQPPHAAPDDFEPLVLRFAPDEALAVGATGVHVDDADAIVEPEVGWVALMFPVDEFFDLVLPRIEWSAPTERPSLAQGAVAGVPAKVYIDSSGAATVFVLAAYLDDLLPRLPVAPS
jgi:hypothetical protein